MALRAAGFPAGARGPAAGRLVGRADLARVVARLGAVQIDSVNVAARAHLMPFYSRLGPYDVGVLDTALSRRPPLAVEYWAHEAALVHAPLLVPLKWRMARAGDEAWSGMAAVARQRPELVHDIVATLAQRPMTARQLQAVLEPHGHRPSDHWGWNWTDVKRGVEWLFWTGQVSSLGRTAQFERRYTTPEHVWPAAVLAAPTPEPEAAGAALLAFAAAALGVATAADLRDYFRLPATVAAAAMRRLTADGVVQPVSVDGWAEPGWVLAGAGIPGPRTARATTAGTTLLSPFDPLVWHRPRTERIFGFTYRLEIYVPKPKRRHGYYVLPLLHAGRLVARVDLRADRARGVLEVPAAWVEPGAPSDTADALAVELMTFARWLGLPEVANPVRGDLAPALTVALPLARAA